MEISEYGLYTAQYGFIWDRARYIVLQIQNYEFWRAYFYKYRQSSCLFRQFFYKSTKKWLIHFNLFNNYNVSVDFYV